MVEINKNYFFHQLNQETFATQQKGNWDERTFAKTSGIVTRARATSSPELLPTHFFKGKALETRFGTGKKLANGWLASGSGPAAIQERITGSISAPVHNHNTQRRNDIYMPSISSRSGLRLFSYSAAKLYNKLDVSIKSSHYINNFVKNYWSKSFPNWITWHVTYILEV